MIAAKERNKINGMLFETLFMKRESLWKTKSSLDANFSYTMVSRAHVMVQNSTVRAK